VTSWCARHTVTPPPYTVTAKLLYNFLTAFFFLNHVIAKTRKVRSRITRDACTYHMQCDRRLCLLLVLKRAIIKSHKNLVCLIPVNTKAYGHNVYGIKLISLRWQYFLQTICP